MITIYEFITEMQNYQPKLQKLPRRQARPSSFSSAATVQYHGTSKVHNPDDTSDDAPQAHKIHSKYVAREKPDTKFGLRPQK